MIENNNELKNLIDTIPDWPKPGVEFKDINPLLMDYGAFDFTRIEMVNLACDVPGWCDDIEYVVAPEARGFIFGTHLAWELEAGFVPIRKSGKMPPPTDSISYMSEYGEAVLHVRKDFAHQVLDGPRSKILIHDDILATGGTASAIYELMKVLGHEPVGFCFLGEIKKLEGRDMLPDLPIISVLEL